MRRGMQEPAVPRHVVSILAILLVVRVFAAILIAPDIVSDAQGYRESARRLIETGTFAYPLYEDNLWARSVGGEPVFRDDGRPAFYATPSNAFVMPGYPVFLAAVWRATGFGTDPGMAVRVAQALLSVCTAALVYLIGRRVDKRTAVLALIVVALYPPFTLANSYLNMEALYGFLLTAAVYLMLRWYDKATWLRAASVGAVFGVGALVRPTALPWLLLAVVFVIACQSPRWRIRLLQGIAILLTAALLMSPWAARNHALYGKPLLFGTSASVNYVQGLWQDSNYPHGPAWDRNESTTPPDSEIARLTQDVFESAPRTATDDLAVSEYYRSASRELLTAVLNNDAAYVFKARAKSVATSLTWPHAISPTVLDGLLFTMSWIIHCTLLAFALIGATRLRGRPDLWLVASVPVYFVTVHAIIFPLWRHYFPTLGLVCVIAAIGVLFCYDFSQPRTR